MELDVHTIRTKLCADPLEIRPVQIGCCLY